MPPTLPILGFFLCWLIASLVRIWEGAPGLFQDLGRLAGLGSWILAIPAVLRARKLRAERKRAAREDPLQALRERRAQLAAKLAGRPFP